MRSKRSMRVRLWILAAAAGAIVVAASAGPRAQQAATPKRIALVGGQLLTGYEVPPVHHAAVLIEGDKIVAAGPASEVKIPADAQVVDTSGRTMMPGLIETHAHLITLGHGNYGTWFPWIAAHGGDTKLRQVMETAAKELLWAGVTTAVDLGAPLKPSLDIRDRINKGEVVGPHMLMSGPWISRNEHGAMQDGFGGVNINTPEEAAAQVDKLAAAGVDTIKAHAGLTPDDYKAISKAAHAHNLKVQAHVYAEEDVQHALDGGVDILTHAGSAGDAPPFSQKLIDDIAKSGRAVVVTAAHRSWLYPDTAAFPERLQNPILKQLYPPDIYDEVQNSLKNWWTLGYFARSDREQLYRERGLKQFIESGVVMGMGTDSGTPMNFHSESLWREVKVHVDMGMTPARAIDTVTRINAMILGKGRDTGSIEPGKHADIIVVEGNPLFDIVALSRVEMVMKDGVMYKGGPASQPKARGTSSSAK